MKNSTPPPNQMLTQSRRQQLQRLKDNRLVKKYVITLHKDSRGKWDFSFHGHLSWFQGFCLTLAGFEIREVE